MNIYQIEGFNTSSKQWETMPYQIATDGENLEEFPIEYIAQTVLAHWREFCPGVEFRLVEVV